MAALLVGSDAGIERLDRAAVTDPPGDGSRDAPVLLREALRDLQGGRDELNQYSYPFGLPGLRRAIAAYTARWSGFEPDPETETTVVLGSTEGLAAVLAAAGRRGDGLVVIEPFHEMYPAQAGGVRADAALRAAAGIRGRRDLAARRRRVAPRGGRRPPCSS